MGRTPKAKTVSAPDVPQSSEPSPQFGTTPGAADIKAAVSGDGTGSGTDAERIRRPRKPKEEDLIQQDLEKLYSPEAFGEVAALPFTITAILRDFDEFQATAEEKIHLGAPLALIAKHYLKINPLLAAAIIMAMNASQIWAMKEIAWSKEKARRKGLTEPEKSA